MPRLLSRRERFARMPKGPPLETRPLLSADDALALARFFKVVADPNRLRILHFLMRTEEVRVGDLADGVGMTVQAVSNQLKRLLDLGVVSSRRDGTSIHYRLHQECVACLLDHGQCLLEIAHGRRA